MNEDRRDISEFKQQKSAIPIYLQLANWVAQLVELGDLRPGMIVPSSRELATKTGLSRDTIVKAYRELHRLAYLHSIGPRGTFVAPRPISTRIGESYPVKKTLTHFASKLVNEEFRHPSSTTYAALNFGAVPKSALPVHRWRKIFQALCTSKTFRSLEYEPNVLGRIELRTALKEYLFRTRGIECDWQQIAIFSLSSGIINILCKALLEPGQCVAVEEPGYGAIKNIAKSHNLELAPIRLDDEGISISGLQTAAITPKLVYVTAGHHDPTGIIMSLKRRRELLAWAQKNDAWIIDDDYDGNFYYGQHPPTSLWSLQQDSNVICSYSFWQILYPLSSIGFAVLPRQLIPIVTASKELQTDGFSDSLVQLTLKEMLNGGYLEQHLRRVQRTFSRRRSSAILELKRRLGPKVQINKFSAGSCFVIYMRAWSRDEIQAAIAKSGLPLVSTESYYLEKPVVCEFLLNFSLLPEEEMTLAINSFAQTLTKTFRTDDGSA